MFLNNCVRNFLPRCEVCEVSVNSSHQLQAHMTGMVPISQNKPSQVSYPLLLEVGRVFNALYIWIFNFEGLLCSELVLYPNKNAFFLFVCVWRVTFPLIVERRH